MTWFRHWVGQSVGIVAVAFASAVWAQQAGEAYERGAGVPLGCGAEEQKDGDLCYPKCKDKFKGEGEQCKQICPANTQDAETHCLSGPYVFRKQIYERGKGRTANECPQGTERDGELCYPACKPGFKPAGKMCQPG
jgi:hypothetical protein